LQFAFLRRQHRNLKKTFLTEKLVKSLLISTLDKVISYVHRNIFTGLSKTSLHAQNKTGWRSAEKIFPVAPRISMVCSLGSRLADRRLADLISKELHRFFFLLGP
jgi:hypothetical protein